MGHNPRCFSRLPVAERFEVNHLKMPFSGCWIWLGAEHGSNRYGTIKADGRTMMAHRYSYMLHNGLSFIPSGLVVMHKCDIPLCVNPSHLRLGTQADNDRDKVSKGRQARGASLSASQSAGWKRSTNRPGHSVLSVEQVREIRASQLSQRHLARKFNVSQAAIHNVKARKTHVNW